MKKIAIGCLLSIAFSLHAQQNSVLDNLDPSGGGALFRNKVLDKQSQRITGSPFLEEKYLPSEISNVENVFLTRYNAYADEIEISYDDAVFVIPKEERYNSIWNKKLDYKFELLRFLTDKNETKFGYLINLFSQGNVAVYKREEIALLPGREATNSYSLPIPPSYSVRNPEYYLKMDESKIIPFPKNKKGLLAVYPNKKEAISTYLKANKISFKKEQDMIELTRFLAKS